MDSQASEEVLVSRDGAIITLTFNRPEARNAMTWGMYQRLYEVCEEVDADDSIRVLVLKGAAGKAGAVKAFVAGTDISQFTQFKGAEDGIKYEEGVDRRSGRVARVKKPVIAQIEGVAVGGGLAISAGADIRIATPEAPSACRPPARSATASRSRAMRCSLIFSAPRASRRSSSPRG
jgi:enoyl-CoA hydratase/carnithine racemase